MVTRRVYESAWAPTARADLDRETQIRYLLVIIATERPLNQDTRDHYARFLDSVQGDRLVVWLKAVALARLAED
jgi:hypothetical protein